MGKNLPQNLPSDKTFRTNTTDLSSERKKKTCEQCKEEFAAKRSTARFCSRRCKERARYAANPEKKRARNRARYAANPEKAKAAGRARYAANPEKAKARNARPEVKAARAAYRKAYLEKERAADRAADRARYAANPEKVQEQFGEVFGLEWSK